MNTGIDSSSDVLENSISKAIKSWASLCWKVRDYWVSLLTMIINSREISCSCLSWQVVCFAGIYFIRLSNWHVYNCSLWVSYETPWCLQAVKNLPACRRTKFYPWDGKILELNGYPLQYSNASYLCVILYYASSSIFCFAWLFFFPLV